MPKKPFLVGIAGGSCSGKTSIADRLVDLVEGRAIVLGLDSYYHDFTGIPEEDIEVDAPESLDRPLLASQLRTLAAGRPIEKPVYDYATHSRKRTGSRIEPEDYGRKDSCRKIPGDGKAAGAAILRRVRGAGGEF